MAQKIFGPKTLKWPSGSRMTTNKQWYSSRISENTTGGEYWRTKLQRQRKERQMKNGSDDDKKRGPGKSKEHTVLQALMHVLGGIIIQHKGNM